MNYSNSRLQNLLAAEYVLGSLHGAARRRFESLLSREPRLRDEVDYWQLRLNPLVETVLPVQPRPQVWRNIQLRIRGRSGARSLEWLWNSLVFWRGFAVASAAALFLVSLSLLRLNTDYQQAIHYVAVLENEQAQPMLIASMDERNMLTLDMLGPDNTGPDKVMEVWSLPKDGSKPVSLGLLKGQRARLVLTREQLEQLEAAGEIAISIEPAGGSPSGLPTGPVMYRGNTI
ncbi:MAG TPA: anti-sigma factor [Gammaproteobacteria bacterium]